MKNNKMNTEKIKALITLLDDPDNAIYNSVRNELLSADFSIIPDLQSAFEVSEDALKIERFSEILDQIKLEKLTFDIENWRKSETPDLVEGMLHIARYGYPNLNAEVITSLIDEMVASIKPKIDGKSPKEIADLLNEVILEEFGFGGSHKEYSAINNSYISKVFETRMSNPIGLSILYLLVAKATKIPLVGINSPGHFILGYLEENNNSKGEVTDKITFFIDPFNKGKIIKSNDFNRWLKLQALPQKVLDALVANEKAIVKRVFNNLIHALYTYGEKTTAKKLLLVAETIE